MSFVPLYQLYAAYMLDGGHIVFYVYEIIRRKTPTLKQMENFGKIGFALIVPLLLFLIVNDLFRVNFFGTVMSYIQKVFGMS